MAFATPAPILASTPLTSQRVCRRTRHTLHSATERAKRRAHTPRASASDSGASSSDLLASADFVERIRGVSSLASSEGDASAVAERVSALLPLAVDDSSGQVRFCALSALAAQPADKLDDAQRSVLLDAARGVLRDDSEMTCRCGAADVIAALKLNDGFNDLVVAYRSEAADWMLRLSIVAGMGEMAHAEAFAFLSDVVDPDAFAAKEPLVLAAAVGALGDLGDPRALPIVERFVGVEDEAVRERASIAKQMLDKTDT